jgi:hypothetical protein
MLEAAGQARLQHARLIQMRNTSSDGPGTRRIPKTAFAEGMFFGIPVGPDDPAGEFGGCTSGFPRKNVDSMHAELPCDILL